MATRRLPDPLSEAEAAASVTRHARIWEVLDLSWLTVREALRGVEQFGMSYWDAVIWATARLAGAPVVLSEDSPTGRIVTEWCSGTRLGKGSG